MTERQHAKTVLAVGGGALAVGFTNLLTVPEHTPLTLLLMAGAFYFTRIAWRKLS